MKILVIGGTGWVGHTIAKTLHAHGLEVTILTRGRKQTYANSVSEIPSLVADKHDRAAMEEILAAGYTHIIDTVPTLECIDIIRKYARGLQHYLHCSSTGGYAPLPFIPCDETAPYGGFTPTAGWSQKMILDNTVMEAFRAEAFPTTVIRPCYITGPGMIPIDNLGGRRADFIDDIVNERTLDLPDNGLSLLQPIHVQDLANAFLNAIDNPGCSLGQTYIICLDHAVTLNRYLEITAAAFGKKAHINYLPLEAMVAKYGDTINETWLRFLATHMCFTNAKARRELGFQPTHTTEEAITETAIWTHNRQG